MIGMVRGVRGANAVRHFDGYQNAYGKEEDNL